MYDVSQEYIDSMKKPIRNYSYMKIALGLINQDAQISAYLNDTTPYTEYSDTETIFSKSDIGNEYATYEQDYFRADGKMKFLPRNVDEYTKNGIISKELFPGSFSIKFIFGCGKSDIKGLTIQFGDNYPSRFTVVDSEGNAKEFQNNSSKFETEEVFENTDSLTLNIQELSVPNNRVRIFYIKFGLGLEYDNDWIISTESSSSLSTINEDLPETSFSFNLKNEDQIFSVDNPSSSINFLETEQKVSVMIGYELDSGETEWFQMHTLYVEEWSANDETATIKAVDRFKYMSDDYFKGRYYKEGITLYDLAVEVLTDAGLQPEEYYLDSYLKKVTVYNPLPNVSHKEALQIIANAGRCILDFDRFGKIRIYSYFIPEFVTTSNGTVDYSDVTSIDKETPKTTYASYSQDYWTCDGSMVFLPKSGEYNAGYVSKQISGDDGTFEENPIITRTFIAKEKNFTLHIDFEGNPPDSFVIRSYADGKQNGTYTENGNTSNVYDLEYDFGEFDKIEIEFTKTSVPNNRVQIKYLSIESGNDYEITYDDMNTTPVGTQLEKIKNLNVSRFLYSESDTEEELSSDEIIYDENTVLYYFENPCYGYRAEIEEGQANESVSVINSGAYYVELQFSGVTNGKKIKYQVYGHKYNVSSSIYTVPINNRGTNKDWSNPLISDLQHCKDVANWVADYYRSGVEYSIDYRGEPALDCGDKILQENKYNDNLISIVEESNISFNKSLSGTLKTRREGNVDRTKIGLG